MPDLNWEPPSGWSKAVNDCDVREPHKPHPWTSLTHLWSCPGVSPATGDRLDRLAEEMIPTALGMASMAQIIRELELRSNPDIPTKLSSSAKTIIASMAQALRRNLFRDEINFRRLD